ncbi:chromosome partitioning protein ParA [Vibrio sinaloensis]|uniref:chromosome partitioning protein ParA n=1 Tax=Photobacterium sp. (strain ATCC 43367) TaxID=379097 RepID=UPI000580B0B8|nr:chromosome partitioning protein ParA [Vibrio sinaloensis]KHT48551.1 chromosome partitioning protein ParA [Vibrio sinaloensis]
MSKQTDIEDNEDVVVIEERDRRSYLYIAIAGVLGLAIGGLAGSSLTAGKWESAYQEMEQEYHTMMSDKQKLVEQVEVRVANVDSEVEDKLKQAIKDQAQEHEAALKALQSQIAELEKVNLSLEEQVASQKQSLSQASQQNAQLNRQADIQATLFERSRELFQQELKVKMELEALEKEREQLLPKIDALKADCDAYLEGTSWDAKSDSCDKQDEANSRLSQINQMIKVHQMDLQQMKELAEQLGL